ncbi:MAG: hypothetical protein LDL51_04135 [Chloroflexi bacterium]|nr:hypothetical protein [Chloroflexota bacterium]
MKYQSALKWLVPLVFLLTLFSAGAGLFYQTPGEPYPFISVRGEQVTINARGLYYYDTVSSAAQMQANDLITLTVGLPLLAVSAWMAFRGSLRGRLLLTGTLAFILYTYMSMATLAAFNALFLAYVALFALSLYAFIFCMMSFDLDGLPERFSENLPRGWIAGLNFVVAGFLSLAWLGRVLAPLTQGSVPPLENGITMVIQFMDLALIVPAAALGGILLLRRSTWGYLLSSVVMTKGITLGLAVSAMSINMALKGVPDSLGIIVPFLFITVANLILTVVLLKNVKE